MKTDTLKDQLRRTLRRDLWLVLGPSIVLAIAAFAVAFYFIKPAPPKTLVVAAAQDEGGFNYFARRYRDILARHGVTLEIRSTQGSLTSLDMLTGDDAKADVAFVQSGSAAGRPQASNLVSLGGLTHIPLWVFYRGEPMEDVRGLRGKRVAVGTLESGTRALALTLLKANAVDQSPTELLSLERDEALARLKQGELDAVFLVASAEAPFVRKLIAQPGIRLLSFARGEAYVRRFPYLSRLVLPRGVLNLEADLPEQDVVLIAPMASLVARDSLHPALAYLLLSAASEVHGGPGILDRLGEFPAALEGEYPLSEEARRYYKSGPPLLQRYLPFWAANLVDRLWLMLVPIIAVLVPLGRAVPAVVLWRIRSRIVRWYARLKEIELQLEENPGREMLEKMLSGLDEAERAVNRIPMPLAYAENLYFFREHIDVVRRRVTRRLAGAPDEGEALTQRVVVS
ncbi:C4-dicarboxylate ABC transporter substrate-binding protein [Cystobacter ferrugineus]|uniref:C4-dicarboxylate ABC transporter substrate-binding protein n=1 Tax=Cystobacter ferrugineus TaxID=83449 RepID=A0A1L9B9U5_9BACT|nr:TAXI family TRAP transporter solute-binding subunit [Cystobacter ferrugineus]OJH39022.1 C4-dicarboxylate ABC transporter substrate-binding protein [Cystobacter ferrugineus]